LQKNCRGRGRRQCHNTLDKRPFIRGRKAGTFEEEEKKKEGKKKKEEKKKNPTMA